MSGNEEMPQLMHIGAVTERTDLSFRTLRHYDEIGLITPSERTAGGFRLYSESDVERILLIRRMKPLDFTLDQMRELLEATDAAATHGASEDARRRVQEFEEIAIERRQRLARKVEMADEFLTRLRELSTTPSLSSREPDDDSASE
ncbi:MULTISPECIES: MerR family transcriptional regulator [unclassified Brachybacterium]|uniref:MerR family transcriptional regulator n=1 Tax=unclassified Brachybacterium TaxID=2623841 RepID=UPI004034E7F3